MNVVEKYVISSQKSVQKASVSHKVSTVVGAENAVVQFATSTQKSVQIAIANPLPTAV